MKCWELETVEVGRGFARGESRGEVNHVSLCYPQACIPSSSPLQFRVSPVMCVLYLKKTLWGTG